MNFKRTRFLDYVYVFEAIGKRSTNHIGSIYLYTKVIHIFISGEMADYLTSFLVFVTTVIVVVITYLRHRYRYWKNLNVPYLEPKFPFGNLKGFPRGIGIGKISYEFYHEFKKTGTKIGGEYFT